MRRGYVSRSIILAVWWKILPEPVRRNFAEDRLSDCRLN